MMHVTWIAKSYLVLVLVLVFVDFVVDLDTLVFADLADLTVFDVGPFWS